MEYFYVFPKNLEYLRKGNFCIVNQQNEWELFQVLLILPPSACLSADRYQTTGDLFTKNNYICMRKIFLYLSRNYCTFSIVIDI